MRVLGVQLTKTDWEILLTYFYCSGVELGQAKKNVHATADTKLKQQIEQLTSEVSQYKTEVSRLNRDLSLVREEKVDLESQLDAMTKEITSLKSRSPERRSSVRI